MSTYFPRTIRVQVFQLTVGDLVYTLPADMASCLKTIPIAGLNLEFMAIQIYDKANDVLIKDHLETYLGIKNKFKKSSKKKAIRKKS